MPDKIFDEINGKTVDGRRLADTLNRLIEICRDGERGYQAAAQGVKNDALRDMFLKYSDQRHRFISELQDEIRLLGLAPRNSGSMTGALHRGWLNLRSAVSGGDQATILAECQRGEDAALEIYEETLQEELPAQVRELIQRQYEEVKETDERIHEFDEAIRPDFLKQA
jgi:uncharacterized protein (TIGR02284 family)